ncbi:MAG: S8 family serine peptidase, partial [Anaerolineae bacterium]|nr:S8 family serine peptidase [Anaerolineae bacterium]
DFLEPAADALRAAGIMMVVSAGNSGPGCQTVSEPPARYDSVFSVGATNLGSSITSFSSRGPVPGDESLLKPDISAPGSNIRSSLAGGGYGTADGTSMAGPHVAGLVALIWSANPDLIGQIDATEDIIRQSAEPAEVVTTCQIDPANSTDEPSVLEELENLVDSSTCACGDVTGVPNNVYGWGEINALKAVQLARTWGAEQE